MKLFQGNPKQAGAEVIDPTGGQLRELKAMLSRCPNCSRWIPGDGAIMATLPGQRNVDRHYSKKTF